MTPPGTMICSVCHRTIQPGEWMESDDSGGLSHSDCRHEGRRGYSPIAPKHPHLLDDDQTDETGDE